MRELQLDDFMLVMSVFPSLIADRSPYTGIFILPRYISLCPATGDQACWGRFRTTWFDLTSTVVPWRRSRLGPLSIIVSKTRW